jgi:uncharacterized protein (DUF58 family)
VTDLVFVSSFLLILAAFLLHANFALSLAYGLLGIYLVNRLWSEHAIQAIILKREFIPRAFQGERIPVHLVVENKGRLPIPWLQVNENLPVELSATGIFRRVFYLGPRKKFEFDYSLEGRKRGYYPVGPLTYASGDLFGFAPNFVRSFAPGHMVVYPRIVSLTTVPIPSRSPLGNLRYHQPIFEDPSRTFGKRDYRTGDSLRRVDWKASASAGKLLVKYFEPSLALETAIFVNLNSEEYDLKTRFNAPELAITIAASLANWIIQERQAVGLGTNGLDPFQESEKGVNWVPIHRGRHHLMRVLELLARVKIGASGAFSSLLQQTLVNLPWGATMIILTPQADNELFEIIFQSQRRGLNAILALCGDVTGVEESRSKADKFGIGFFHFQSEEDLDIWRR